MSSDRDHLFRVGERALKRMQAEHGLRGLSPGFAVSQMVDQLAEEGWRPPAQRIETAEQLDALPQHAVIRRGITIYQHIVGDGWWIEQGVGEVFHSEQIIDIADGDEIVVLWAGGDS